MTFLNSVGIALAVFGGIVVIALIAWVVTFLLATDDA